jgi:predicted nucleotidyltransferase component of viral defense system
MASVDFLHRHSEFSDLLRLAAAQMAIDPALVEKDYWIMHCLYGLQWLGLSFELKGGTSLSKGYGLIERFSEDIDIRIEPAASMNVKVGKNKNKRADCESRRAFL